MRLDGAMLFVRDLDRMVAFYRDVLQLKPIEATRQDDWVEFDADGARVALHAIPPHLIDGEASSSPREDQASKLIFAVDDLGAVRERLSGAGVRILDRPWGGWDAVDPEGNILGFRQSTGR